MKTISISSFSQHQGLARPSLDYYAFRGLPYRQFQALQVIYALYYQLAALPTCSEDIQVIRHKAQFWLNDLLAVYTGTPSHPVSRDLQALLPSFPLQQEDWLKILTAAEIECDGLLLENEQEIRSYADKCYGSLFRLIASVLSPQSPPVDALRDLAQARALLMFLQHPEGLKLRAILPENSQAQIFTLIDHAVAGLKATGNPAYQPLRVLGRLIRHQAKHPMVHLGPLKTLGLSICERLSSTS